LYWVVVYVQFSDDPQVLFTKGNYPRAWVSLDKLVAYFEKKWPRFPGISVVITRSKRNTAVVQRVEAVG
jgi:hypothetical protein